ncbi:MAG: nucleoside deaminase [Ruminococcaceae bacterium]|nr:nucleoside deaminase [Oscillospiraceae bacterium]
MDEIRNVAVQLPEGNESDGEFTELHINFMKKALEYASFAEETLDVPVGAVVVCDGEIVSYGYNRREGEKNALCHAEIEAINGACKKLGGWRLHRCDLYVTLEPCPMCAGAIINSRIKNVYFGASDNKAGAFGGLFDMNKEALNHHPNVVGGVCADECSKLLSDFFAELRKRKKSEKEDKKKSDI